MKIFLNLKFVFFLYIVFLTSYLSFNYFKTLLKPVATSGDYEIIKIEKGLSFQQIAELLEKKGFIRSKEAFFILAWYKDYLNNLKAGEYKISPAMSPEEILEVLVKGQVIQHLITIPEGYNIFQIADLLERAALAKKEEFLKTATDRKLLLELNLKEETSVEGYLFPDSYFFSKDISSREIIKHLNARFWRIWKDNDFDKRIKQLKKTVHDIITLASIVELEAAVEDEKPIIASVFWNRLEKGMPLQADPTVKYGILVEKRIKKRRLTWKDLRKPTPYNTYTKYGLPAGPICNPGLSSIKAVLYPKKTKFLYFVSKGNRRHYFSKTLKEHNRAVKKYILKK